ncbi:MAG: diaminopimelate epimerase [Candidatus Bathyarchaeota archaeon]|nr:diaminopimelate epimerase [Candidatus Bathyarchaeota archaeon]
MRFWKMHGLGNDYIVIDNRNNIINEENTSKLARKLCERRFSIGADGLILVFNSIKADIKMRIFNLDGSEAEMCGNGIRCFSKYCYENNIIRKKELTIETLAGLKKTRLTIKDQTVIQVDVDMGVPIFEKHKIPMQGRGKCINEDLIIDGTTFQITCLSVGNPHCVIFVDNVDEYPVHLFGPKIENHPIFPNRINVVFAEVVKKDLLKVRVWERGCGETLACGTGACAAVIAGNIIGKTKNKVKVCLHGGELEIKYNEIVFMKGPVEKVFEGRLF